jgi:hypothetical protein
MRMNMLILLPRLTEREREMMIEVGDFRDSTELALSCRDRLDAVIDALLEAERRGLFETEGVDLACKLMSLRDEPTWSAPTQEQASNWYVSNHDPGLTLGGANTLKDGGK